jgi:hypothetical protein
MLYSQILEYQARSIYQISKNVLLRSFSLPSTWESLLSEIKTSDIVCKQKMSLLSDFRINKVRIETQNLSQYLETRFKDLEDSSLSKNITFGHEYSTYTFRGEYSPVAFATQSGCRGGRSNDT